MSGSSQSKRKSKLKLEPISYEEMLGTAGMSGFVSFLDVTPPAAAQQLRVEREPDTAVENPSLPPVSLPEVTTLQPFPSMVGAPYAGIPQRGTPETTGPHTGIPLLSSDQSIVLEQFDIDESGTPETSVPDLGVRAKDTSQSIALEQGRVDESGTLEQGTPDLNVDNNNYNKYEGFRQIDRSKLGIPFTTQPTADRSSSVLPSPLPRQIGAAQNEEPTQPEIQSSQATASGIPDSSRRDSMLPIPALPDNQAGSTLHRHDRDAPVLLPTANFYLPDVNPPNSGTPESGVHESDFVSKAYPPLQPRTHRIRRATRVQDGHSLGEQALYDALWQSAQPYSSDTRIITIGYRRMSELARLTVNNCKANVRALIQKLAVSEASPFSHSQGTTYFVYNFTTILQRRKVAGFTHYIRSRGVAFVDADTGEPLTRSMHIQSGTPDSGLQQSPAVPESDTLGTPEPTESGIPVSGSHIYRNNKTEKPNQETTATFLTVPPELGKGLHTLVPLIDAEAIAILWSECRTRVADCTVGEILHFAETKSGMFGTGKIQNPVGFLLAVVPKCFEGTTFSSFREDARRREENRQKVERNLHEARKAEEQSARREAEAYQRAEEKLKTLPKEVYETLYQTTKKDLFTRSRAPLVWSAQVLEHTIKSRILRELQRQELIKI